VINPRRLIKLTQKVLSINSENPPGNEKKLAAFIAKDMRSLGLNVREYTFEKDRPNIVATLKGKGKQASRQALLLTPHFDTVPIGNGWTKDPLGKDIEGGRIYGRGASDDKGNLACSLEVMRSLVEDGVQLDRDVIMAATVDEETGSHCGIIPLLEKGILKPQAALILDSDEFDAIIAQKGLLHCRVLVKGKKAHGAYNWRGVNAVEQAAEMIRLIKKIKFAFRKHSLLRPPSINVGTISGGDKVNMVADHCEFTLDIRFLPGMNGRVVLKTVREVCAKVTKRVKIVIDDLQQPYEISPEHPFVTTCKDTAAEIRLCSKLKGCKGATVITFFKRKGIPAFATGFGAKGTAHTTDEYAKLKTLTRGAEMLERFVRNYCG